MTTVGGIFRLCVEAAQGGQLIVRENASDKEFHFQNWFKKRLDASGLHYEQGGRNSYPDFSIVKFTDGYELKGLAYPGRDASFDSNSQAPRGQHNGRDVYYVFGRYPKKPDGNSFPVIDLVICHGDFLNADHDYVHKNRSVKGFGSYGDIMIRDRKMYVVPTPFHLVDGLAHQFTLILPESIHPGEYLSEVGQLQRVECSELVVGYSFDLQTNALDARRVPNPGAGTVHRFRAWRALGAPSVTVAMKDIDASDIELETEEDDEE